MVPDTVRTDIRTDRQLIGELDLLTASILETLIEQQIATGHLEVRIDVSELAFCDVMGLRALLLAHRRLAALGGQLMLLRPRPLLARTAALCGYAAELGLQAGAPAAQRSGGVPTA